MKYEYDTANDSDTSESGWQLGFEGIERLVGNAERYCEFERERMDLTNRAAIQALRAELSLLAIQEHDLEDRICQAPPPGSLQSRKRRALYSWAIVFILVVGGFFFSLLAFEPYQLGWKSHLYCLGIAIVTPFCAEKLLESCGKAKLVNTLAATAFLAAITSLVLLAVIRGDLLTERIKDSAPVSVFGDDDSVQTNPRTTFYDETSLLLRVVMALVAVAMEIGAGLALYDARRLGLEWGEDREKLASELKQVHELMVSDLYQLTALENQPARFVARFWRDFYRSMLTQTARNALGKLFLLVLGFLVLSPNRAEAADHLNLVVLVDLTKSVAVKGHDGKTEGDKNLQAVAWLLAEVPAGSRITVLGITDHSFSEPDILLSADIGDDEGYFKQRLAAAHRQLILVWQKRIQHLERDFRHTDILGALLLSSQIFQQLPTGRKDVLIVFSDMRQSTGDLDLETIQTIAIDAAIRKAESEGMIANLKDAEVYVHGADNAGRSTLYWSGLQEFWAKYFKVAGTTLKDYSVLRDPIVLER